MQRSTVLGLFALLIGVASALSPIEKHPLLKTLSQTGDAAQHYGYINVNKTYDANVFYWMFESQGNPATDPVVLWMTGGPGCSSELAIFFENGPYTVDGEGKLSPNPYSWNKFANLLYVDQPVGTGFSYASKDYVHDEAAVATEMWNFLQGWMAKYPQFQSLPFYIVGESYGGHYVPTVADRIIKEKGNGIPINLKAIGIGNGWVDPQVQYAGYGPFAFENKLIDEGVYREMNATLDKCNRLIEQKDWNAASYVCGNIMGAVLQAAGNLNVYNIHLPCDPPPLCYNFDNITAYLNTPAVQQQLGVASHHITWETCNDEVNGLFGADIIESFRYEIPPILKSGVRVVVYNGDLIDQMTDCSDLICNWVGGKMWVDSMVWTGQNAFLASPTQRWTVNGHYAGYSNTAQGLTFVRVGSAGHMVPHDQPKNALQLLSNIITGTPFTNN